MWERIKIPEPATPHDERERPFTDEEVRKLLAGPASPPMHDLMMIATLDRGASGGHRGPPR